MSSDVKNYFDQPDNTGDNALHLDGTVYVDGTELIDASITITTGNNITLNSGATLSALSGSTVTLAGTNTLSGTNTISGATTISGTTTVNSISFTAQKLSNILRSNEYLDVNSNGALNVYGFNVIAGGTGLSGLTLAAPQPGVRCVINIASLASGTVIVTTAAGVTFDGTNNTATFNAVNDQLILVYNSSTQWKIAYNNSVTLSSV